MEDAPYCFEYSNVQDCNEYCATQLDGFSDHLLDACEEFCEFTCSDAQGPPTPPPVETCFGRSSYLSCTRACNDEHLDLDMTQEGYDRLMECRERCDETCPPGGRIDPSPPPGDDDDDDFPWLWIGIGGGAFLFLMLLVLLL